MQRVRQETVHHPALPYAKLPAFLDALRRASANEATKLAFEFQILTASRTGEVRLARWDEIDRGTCTWTGPLSG